MTTDRPGDCPLEVIGLVRTPHGDRASTPIQAALNAAETGTVEVFDQYVEGLIGLEEFDYLWLITWLDRRESEDRPPLTQVPYLLGAAPRSMGVFAMRGPRRVNSIGLSLVRLVEVSGSRITFAGVDLVDRTPLIDIKPYVTRFDRPDGQPTCGWFDTVAMPQGATPASLRPGSGPAP